MKEYYFKNNEFVIENYDRQKTFSSFLPGLAGKRGIPLWAFYVNRGQGMTSFGVENKDSQILEFNPAVVAYQSVGIDGFRTFVKIDGKVHEIFGENHLDAKRTMRIKRSEFSVEEVNATLGLKVEVTYFGLPNENIAALVRKVVVTNLKEETLEFEMLDGISQLLPHQVKNGDFKALANLIRSWMEVYSLDNNVGYYRMRSSSADVAEVIEVQSGNFYVSNVDGELIKPIVDSRLVFDYDTGKNVARFFENHSIEEIYNEEQVTANKIPVGFTGLKLSLSQNESKRINTVIGHTHSEENFVKMAKGLSDSEYLDSKRQEAFDVIEDMLEEVTSETSFPIFDDYIKQNFLDNLLRGGYPLILKGDNKNLVYHLYSRRHGDLERDYNYFSLAPEFYSQGNGSFRDVCQNRRNDVLINPEVEDFNMKMFASFIQADGYNPMSIDGSSFEIEDKEVCVSLVNKLFGGSQVMIDLLCHKFTPGSIINTLANNNIETSFTDEEIFDEVFKHSTQNYEAHFGEGYWIDHWTYILDLVENYQSVYPDKMHSKLYDEKDYSYFNGPVTVLPRDEKICITGSGEVRRFGSLLHDDHEKVNKLNMNPYSADWFKNEQGEVVKANLFGKLFVLATNKLACLDPSGMGIEMEADKPGWNDAMNGLPGLFGSGVSETIEIDRVLSYLITNADNNQELSLPVEFIEFAKKLKVLTDEDLSEYDFWDAINDVKEKYRNDIRFYTKGTALISLVEVKELLVSYKAKIEGALEKAYTLGDGIYPTYLINKVTKHEPILINGEAKIGNYGMPVTKPLEFEVRALPYYLEAPARALKVMKDVDAKKDMFTRIKASNIYDHELKFYKTSEFLDAESNEIGRGRSFTKGWQERESNFLHMSYKYLLGLLKAGLYEEYFGEIDTNLVCFMDPKVYGRSTLENSSFIATSINPDPFVRGQGYVARLSGSTAEMLSLWTYMMFGKKVFQFDGELKLNLKPILSKEFFKNGEVSFTLFGTTRVTYINKNNIDTYDKSFSIQKYEVDGVVVKEVTGLLAEQVRDKKVKQIKVYF